MDKLPIPHRTSYVVGDQNVEILLVNDLDFHNATALWRSSWSIVQRSPADYLKSAYGRNTLTAAAAQVGVHPDRLWFLEGSCYWFTQPIAMDYAGWISPEFRLKVYRLATMAAQRLLNRADAEWKMIREEGKDERRTFTNAIKPLCPILARDGKDIKYALATDRVYLATFGKKSRDLKDERGLPKRANVRDCFSKGELIATSMVEHHSGRKISEKQIRDPERAFVAIDRIGAIVRESNRRIEATDV